MTAALSGATIDVGGPTPDPGGRPRRARRTTPRSTLTPGAGLGLGITMLWFSLLVLVPLSAIVDQGLRNRFRREPDGSKTMNAVILYLSTQTPERSITELAAANALRQPEPLKRRRQVLHPRALRRPSQRIPPDDHRRQRDDHRRQL